MAIRSFFALPMSVTAERQLDRFAQRLRELVEHSLNPEAGIRWVPPVNYHLTLAFLGDIQPRDQDLLQQIAAEVAAEMRAGYFRVTRCEWFPSPLKPRLLAAMPEQYPPLYQLQKQLTSLLNRHGFHTEKRTFRPHISLARVKGMTQALDLAEQRPAVDCEMDELVLFSSAMGHQGPVYSPLLVEPIRAWP